MNRPAFRLLISFAAYLLFIGLQGARDPAHAQAADQALDTRVTIEKGRLFLGELIETLSQKCGIHLRVDERAAESADPLCIAVRDMPVRQVMDLLTSLYSYQEAPWHWIRETTEQGERLIFTPSLKANLLIGQLENWQQKAWEKQLDAYRVSRTMSPEEQARLNEEGGVLPPYPLMQITRGKADLFVDVLSDEQRLRVMRGQERIRVWVHKLPASGRAFLDAVYADVLNSAKEVPGNLPPPPPFEWVEFDRMVYPGYATADVRVNLGDKYGYSSNSVLGGIRMNAAFGKYLYEKWLLPGEAREDPSDTKTVPDTPVPDPKEVPWPLEARLLQVSRALDVPILCRLSHILSRDPGPPTGKTLRVVLNEWSTGAGYMSKRQSGTLLLSTRAWHLDEEVSMRAPWSVVKRIRSVERTPRKVPDIADLAFAAHRLTVPQLKGLAVEWPVFSHIARYHPIFALCGSSPLVSAAMTSQRGYTLEEADRAAFLPILSFRRLADSTGAVKLRIVEAQGVPPLPEAATSINIEVMGENNLWRSIGGFAYYPRGVTLRFNNPPPVPDRVPEGKP